MNIVERIEAAGMDSESFSRNVETLRGNVEKLHSTVEIDAPNIRALARIAEIRERGLTPPEGDPDS